MDDKKYRPFPQYKPTDGQAVWFCLFVRGAIGQPGVYDAPNGYFTSPDFVLPVEWYCVAEWRPRV